MLRKLLRQHPKRMGLALLVVAFVQMVVVLLAIDPGVLSIDEVTYLAMEKSLASFGGFVIDNGYDRLPSPELESMEIRAVGVGPGARLVAQYPYGFPLMALPFFRAFGASGLVVVNTLAFFGTIWFVHRIAWDLFRRRSIALGSAAVFALGTFAFTYSIAIWPHMTTTFLVTVAIAASIRACQGPSHHTMAGLVAGAASTLRLDGAFVLGALVLAPALLGSEAHGPRGGASGKPLASLRSALAVGLGALPGLAFLGWVNHEKWGSWQPFSYGPWHDAGSNTGLARWLPLAIAGALAILVVHLGAPRLLGASRRWFLVSTIGALGAAIAFGVAWRGPTFVRNAWTVLVDMRAFDGTNEGLMARGPRGEVLYIGGIKLALSATCPWLPLAVFGALGGSTTRGPRLFLAACAGAFLVVFASAGWHGGLCLEQRYLLPALPALSVLAAVGARRVAARVVTSGRAVVLQRLRDVDAVVYGVLAAAFVGMVLARTSFTATRIVTQDVPLLVCAALGVALSVRHRRAPEVAMGLGLAALALAAAVTFGVGAPTTLARRAWNARVARRIAADVRPGDLVVAEVPDFAGVLVARGARVADARRDGSEGLPALAARFCRERPCHAILSPEGALRVAGVLAASGGETGGPRLVVFARENGLVYGRIGLDRAADATPLDTPNVPQ